MLEAYSATVVPVGGLNPAGFIITDSVSTAPHGFSMDVLVTAPTASIVISDPTNPIWSFTVTPVGGLLNADVLHFSSIFGDKDISYTRGVTTIPLADVVSPGAIWPILFPGDNHFQFSNPANLALSAISHFATYWGV